LYCLACKTRFEDYYKHLECEQHIHNMRNLSYAYSEIEKCFKNVRETKFFDRSNNYLVVEKENGDICLKFNKFLINPEKTPLRSCNLIFDKKNLRIKIENALSTVDTNCDSDQKVLKKKRARTKRNKSCK
jgi:hypothetical protein